MHRRRRLLVICLPWLLGLAACVHRGGLTATDRSSIRAVIMQQLEAFRQDDASAAFALASPEIQAKYGTADNFMMAVKRFYEPLYRPRYTGGFANLHMIEGQLTQPVVLVGPDGDFVVALYAMQRQPGGGWKILGCSLIP